MPHQGFKWGNMVQMPDNLFLGTVAHGVEAFFDRYRRE